MSGIVSKKKQNEYLIHCRAEFSGAWVRVSANSEDEAKEKFEAGEWIDGIETDGAELVNYKLSEIELNN